MALICPVCSTENREGANFCKSCGGKLAPAAPTPIPPPPAPRSRSEREWAATAPAQLRAPTIPGGLFGAGMPVAATGPIGAAAPADDQTLLAALGRLRRQLAAAALAEIRALAVFCAADRTDQGHCD